MWSPAGRHGKVAMEQIKKTKPDRPERTFLRSPIPTVGSDSATAYAGRQPLIGRVNRESGMNQISATVTYAPYAIHGLMKAATMPMP